MAKVRLIGLDGEIHGEGEIVDDKLMGTDGVVRNERPYRYRGLRRGVFEFEETTQSYIVTEF